MAKISVLVDNRSETAGTVVSASRIHGGAIAPALAEQFAHVDLAVVEALLRSVEDLLDEATAKMRADEIEYAGEQAETSQMREERDAVHGELSDVFLRVRSLVEGTAGESAKAEFGIDGGIPRTLKELVETSDNAIERLRTSDGAGSDPLSVLFDADRFADVLEGPMQRARELIERVRDEGREDEFAMLERDESVAEWEQTYRGVALILQGLFTIAGRPDLAERVRPTTRRATGQDVPPPVTDDGDEPVVEPVVEPTPVADEA